MDPNQINDLMNATEDAAPHSSAAAKNAARKGKKKDTVKKGGYSYGMLVDEDKAKGGAVGKMLYKMINKGYNTGMIVYNFTGKMLWVGSCCFFLWCFPLGYEIMNENQKILMKIQMSMMAEAQGGGGDMMGGGGGPRPF